MKLMISINWIREGNEIKIGDRFINPDQEFNSLSRENQVKIIEMLKNDLEKLLKVNHLKVARKAGLN